MPDDFAAQIQKYQSRYSHVRAADNTGGAMVPNPLERYPPFILANSTVLPSDIDQSQSVT